MSAITDQARAYLQQCKSLEGDEHEEARKALHEALPKAVRHEARRLQKAERFTPEKARVDQRREYLSPSGVYKLVVTPFATTGWNYSQGLVYRGDELVAEVQRNYGQFPFAWVEGHAKGDFLVCGEDYQGQTVVNLKTGARRDHLPDGAEKGHGFCWALIHPNASGSMLAVEGCYWAAWYEVRVYDFSEPMLLPWPEIGGGNGDPLDFFEWLGDDRLRMGRKESVYTPSNMTHDALYDAERKGTITKEERERIISDEANWVEKEVESREWSRPTALEALLSWANECFPWRQERGIKVHADLLQNTRALLERLSDADRRQFEAGEAKALVDWAFANRDEAA